MVQWPRKGWIKSSSCGGLQVGLKVEGVLVTKSELSGWLWPPEYKRCGVESGAIQGNLELPFLEAFHSGDKLRQDIDLAMR